MRKGTPVDRQVKHTLRSGATAVAVATGLTLLACTGQTTDGFVHTNFTGPLSVFGGSAQLPNDVVAIGDGVADANELSTLLKTVAPQGAGAPNVPVTIRSTVAPSSAGPVVAYPAVDPAAGAATVKQSAPLPENQVIDSQGKANCSAALSCVTDPVTNTTTMTFADGIVAVVQKVNDMTLVAYKSVGDALKSAVDALGLPGDSLPTTFAALAPPTIQIPTPVINTPAPLAAAAVSKPTSAAATPGPTPATDATAAPTSAPAPDLTASSVRPHVTVSRAPQEFGTPKPGNPTESSTSPVNPNGAVNAVTSAVDSVVNAVKSALSPSTPSPGPTRQR